MILVGPRKKPGPEMVCRPAFTPALTPGERIHDPRKAANRAPEPSGTGILACLTGFQPVRLSGAGSPGDRLEAGPTTFRFMERESSVDMNRPHPQRQQGLLAVGRNEHSLHRSIRHRKRTGRSDVLPLLGGEGRGEGGRPSMLAEHHPNQTGGMAYELSDARRSPGRRPLPGFRSDGLEPLT
jgi:hypothetical protein